MRTWIAAVVVAAGLAVVGCKSDDDHSKQHKKMSGDACKMCEGVQHATADGKCPKCGMSVSAMDKKAGMGDACPKCEGVQTANADGSCPMCKM